MESATQPVLPGLALAPECPEHCWAEPGRLGWRLCAVCGVQVFFWDAHAVAG